MRTQAPAQRARRGRLLRVHWQLSRVTSDWIDSSALCCREESQMRTRIILLGLRIRRLGVLECIGVGLFVPCGQMRSSYGSCFARAGAALRCMC